MILARTGNDARVLGSISSAAGIGVLRGQFIVSTWGSFNRQHLGKLQGKDSRRVTGHGGSRDQQNHLWFTADAISLDSCPVLLVLKLSLERHFQYRDLVSEGSPRGAGTAGRLRHGACHGSWRKCCTHSGRSFRQGFRCGNGSDLHWRCDLLIAGGWGGYAFPWLRNVERLVPDHDAADTELKPKT